MNVRMGITGISAAIIGAINSFTVTLFNVPGTVPLLAFTGALLSYGYDVEGHGPRKRGKRFWFELVAVSLTATAGVSVVPSLLGWDWYSTKLEGSVAFLFALGGRFMVPVFFKSIPELFRKWFKIGEYKQIQARDKDETIQ